MVGGRRTPLTELRLSCPRSALRPGLGSPGPAHQLRGASRQPQDGAHRPVVAPTGAPRPPGDDGDARPGQDVVDPEQCRPPAPVRRPGPPPSAEAQKSRRRSIPGPTRRSKLRCWRVALKSPTMTEGRAPEDGGAPGPCQPLGPGPDLGQLLGPGPHPGAPHWAPGVDHKEAKGAGARGRDYGVELGVALARPGLDVAEGHPADQRQPSGARTGVRLDAPPRIGRRG